MYKFFVQLCDVQWNVSPDSSISIKVIKGVTSLCIVLNVRSNRVKGLQLLISMMLIAGSTSKQVHVVSMQDCISLIPRLFPWAKEKLVYHTASNGKLGRAGNKARTIYVLVHLLIRSYTNSRLSQSSTMLGFACHILQLGITYLRPGILTL